MVRSQKYIRSRLSIMAWCYERYAVSLISDFEYDQLASMVDTSIKTDCEDFDEFFQQNYTSHTGLWIYSHPDLNFIDKLCQDFIGEQLCHLSGIKETRKE